MSRYMSTVYKDSVDHVYYSNSIFNNSPNPLILNISDERGQPIIGADNTPSESSSNYEMTVTNFSIPGALIPIFKFIPGQYKVTMEYNGSINTVNVPYIPQSALTTSDPGYFYVYYFQNFIDMINSALATSFAALAGVPVGNVAPYLVYNAADKSISIIATGNDYDESAVPRINLYFNTALHEYLLYFQMFFITYSPIDVKNFRMIFKDNFNNVTVNGGINTYRMTSEIADLNSWSDLNKIVITSNLTCLRQEWYSSNISGDSAASISFPIIAEFVTIPDAQGDLRSEITYTPYQFKWIDVLGSITKKIDFNFYYLTFSLDLIPIYLPPYNSGSITVCFKRKTAYQ